jgi:hypothetical protein
MVNFNDDIIMTPEYYPFWVISLKDYLSYMWNTLRCRNSGDGDGGSGRCPGERKIVLGPSNGWFTIVWRLNPPHGYRSLGDVIAGSNVYDDWAGFESEQFGKYTYSLRYPDKQGNLMLVFIKEKNILDPSRPFAKKCTSARRIPGTRDLDADDDDRGNLNGATSGSGSQTKNNSCGFVVKGSSYGNGYNYGAGGDVELRMYRPNPVDGGNYVPLGLTFGAYFYYSKLSNKWELDELENVWAVRKDLLISLKGNTTDTSIYSRDTINQWYWLGGRQLSAPDDAYSGCGFQIISSACFYDVNNNKIKYLSPADGLVYVKNGVNLGNEDYEKFYYRLPIYLIRPFKALERCCNPNSGNDTSSLECGWGPYKYDKNSPECYDFARQKCTVDTITYDEKENPSGDLISDICIGGKIGSTTQNVKGFCRNIGDNSNEGIVNCDNDFLLFCSKKDINGKYTNYEKYPDICACFMPQDYLKDKCDQMAISLGINGKKAALKALNLDTDDPSQCNQNSCVNPLCRELSIKDTEKYRVSSTRKEYLVQKGAYVDKGKCPDTSLCIQSVQIDISGNVVIGDLDIKQTASCQAYKNTSCFNSKLTECNIYNPTTKKMFKKIIEENDGGACGKVNDEIECSIFEQTPIYDKCKNGYRTQIFKQLKTNVTEKDAVSALKYMAYTGPYSNFYENNNADQFNPVIEYYEEGGLGYIITNCNDCDSDYKKQEGTSCYLSGNVWKQKSIKYKSIQEKNGGVCNINFTNDVVESECTENKDCEVSLLENDSGCTNGLRTIKYNINKLNSGNGKTCSNIVYNLLPNDFKQNNPSVLVSDSKTMAIAQISCRDCIVDYRVDLDTNDGKCYYDGSKWTITKIPVMVREAEAGGKCSADKIKLVAERVKKIEPCSLNQNCSFNTDPDSDVCDEKTGTRTIVFSVNKASNGTGIKCEDVAKQIGNSYTKDPTKIKYSEQNKNVSITSSCSLYKDCQLSQIPSFSDCDTSQNKGIDVYRITQKPMGNGKSCDIVAKGLFGTSIVTDQKKDLLYIYSECGKVETKSTKITKIVIVIVSIIIMSIIAILRA